MKLLRLLSTVCAALGLQFTASAQTISFTGAQLRQDFNGMGTNGTTTPAGWFVGSNAATVINYTTNVTASAGTVAPAGGIRGFNLGTLNSTDRALGTAATGVNRYMEARIRNNTVLGLDSITVSYDGEQWRNGNNNLATNANRLVLQYSADGTNYVDMGAGFNFTQLQDAPANTALDGNDSANRTAGIGGLYTLGSVIQPGSTFFLRWFDLNELQTDPVLGIDNFSFTATTVGVPVTIVITSPTNDQVFAQSADVPVITTTSGSVSNVAFYVDDTFVSTDGLTPFAGTIPTALLPVGNHTITAYATNTAGVMEAFASVSIVVVPNEPPSITISNRVTDVLVGTAITNFATITDDAGVTNVDWFVDGAFRHRTATAPYTFINADSLAGAHTFQATVTDRGGLTASSLIVTVNVTNPPAQFDRLVTNGSVWKYFASTAEPPPDGGARVWSAVGYDDVAWSSGLAELGNGDAGDGYPETTVIDIGPANARYRTVYFRKTFQVSDPTSYGQVLLHLLRDDGAVVYLNDSPVWTNNILVTTSPIVYTNLAGGAGNENLYLVTSLSPASLVVGENTVAVEVHQQNATSSDLGFDLMIWGEIPTTPVVTITSPTNGQSFLQTVPVTVNISASSFITNVDLSVDGNYYGSDSVRPFSIVVSNLSPGTHTLDVVGNDTFSGSASSPTVTIIVTPNQPPGIAITNVISITTNSPAYLVGSAITNQYGFSDDLGVTNVDFYVDGVLLHRDAAGFGQVIVNNALAGLHTFTAVAFDSLGLTASNTVAVNITNPPYALLLTNGSDWVYEDSGATQVVEWVTLGFDDSAWSTGSGEFGFGDAAGDLPERTLLRRNAGLFSTNSLVFYFRKIINVADPSVYTNLIVSALRDDGARIYINTNAVFTTPAAFPPTVATADDGTIYYRANVSPTNLVAGLNIIAVELRQENPGSSDVSFDLMIWGQEGPVLGPPVTITTDGVTVTVSHGGVPGFRLQRSTDIGSPANWVDVPGNPLSLNFPVASQPGPLFFRLISP